MKGELVAIGPTAWADMKCDPWAEVGDTVWFAKYGGFILEHPDTKELYRVLNDDDLMIEEKEEV